jgi:hypothetical protein
MQVFISHASQDRALAIALARAVQAANMDVWTQNSISPGANWATEVSNALEQSDVMIVLFTRGARHSPTLKQDVQYALTNGKYNGRVLPVLVDLPTFEAGTDVPWVLLSLNSIHVQGSPPDFAPVVNQLVELSRVDSNAAT